MGYSKDSKAIWEKELEEAMTILRKCFGNKEIPLKEQEKRFDHINISKKKIKEMNIKDSKEKILTLIEIVNEQDFSE